MKRHLNPYTCILVCLVMMLPAVLSAQTLLNEPESVAYDHVRSRYLVSNHANGNIVIVDSLLQQSYFNTDLNHAVGLHILGDTLFAAYYSASAAGLAGFNLETGLLDFTLPLPDAQWPNGVASDTSGNIYVTDWQGGRLYRIRIADLDYGVFVDTGWTDFKEPNGIVFDKYNNRMLVLGTASRNSPIVAIGVEDTAKSVVVRTRLPQTTTDGLTSDNNGYTYVSSWATDAIHRYGPDFVNPPLEIAGGFNDPADIQFNEYLEEIAVPCFSGDTLRFVPINTTSVGESERSEIPSTSSLDAVYPNPFNPKTEIRFNLSSPGRASLVIYDLVGRRVRLLAGGDHHAGTFTKEWYGTDDSGREVSSGVYFVRLEALGKPVTRKITLLR